MEHINLIVQTHSADIKTSHCVSYKPCDYWDLLCWQYWIFVLLNQVIFKNQRDTTSLCNACHEVAIFYAFNLYHILVCWVKRKGWPRWRMGMGKRRRILVFFRKIWRKQIYIFFYPILILVTTKNKKFYCSKTNHEESKHIKIWDKIWHQVLRRD